MSEPSESSRPSIAHLLDDVRPLIDTAKANGDPRFLMLPPSEFDEIARYRQRDRALGLPMLVLGLEIVRADDPATTPRVF